MEVKLDLIFKDPQQKNKTVRITLPKSNLVEADVTPVMRKIIDSKVLVNTSGEPMVAIGGAKLRTVKDLIDNFEDEEEIVPADKQDDSKKEEPKA